MCSLEKEDVSDMIAHTEESFVCNYNQHLGEGVLITKKLVVEEKICLEKDFLPRHQYSCLSERPQWGSLMDWELRLPPGWRISNLNFSLRTCCSRIKFYPLRKE
jgi:hypothetical protein